jgi:serine/alanine adding enzyme
MERNSAGTRWWFPESYFHNCASCLGEEKISLFSARYQDQTIASFLVMHAYNTLYYHFGGSSEAYFEYRPNNVLMYEIALWGKAQGYGMYHLGGGQRHNDNLYRYKKGFSHDEAYLYTYYRIHNADEYSRLCLLKRQWDREHNIEIHDPGFLPEYRRE